MAKVNPAREAQPKQAGNGIPKPTDERAELFYLLGVIRGQGVEGAARIAELAINLTAPAEIEGTNHDSERS